MLLSKHFAVRNRVDLMMRSSRTYRITVRFIGHFQCKVYFRCGQPCSGFILWIFVIFVRQNQ